MSQKTYLKNIGYSQPKNLNWWHRYSQIFYICQRKISTRHEKISFFATADGALVDLDQNPCLLDFKQDTHAFLITLFQCVIHIENTYWKTTVEHTYFMEYLPKLITCWALKIVSIIFKEFKLSKECSKAYEYVCHTFIIVKTDRRNTNIQC